MMRARITKRALTDIDMIWDYVALHNRSAADRLVDRLGRLFKRLARMPRIGECYSHPIPGMRYFTHGTYVVVYQELEDGIRVLCVAHSARDWQTMIDTMEDSDLD
jgi:toxin ParE1/3/4